MVKQWQMGNISEELTETQLKHDLYFINKWYKLHQALSEGSYSHHIAVPYILLHSLLFVAKRQI